MLFLLILFGFAYFFLITHFISGWRSLPEQNLEEADYQIYLSLVVPFRNEEHNLSALLECLTQQTHKRFQLILIDDHSTDESYALAQSYLAKFPNAILLQAANHGKKQALKQAITYATGDLIVCTDADCLPNADWLKAIAQFQTKEPCDLILAPLKMNASKSLFSRLQALEFASLIASAAGSAATRMPVLANAANMAFTPSLWAKSQHALQENEASGDDMFLLHQAKKMGVEIRFLKSKQAIVEVAACADLKAFWSQRMRWAGKSKSYRDWQTLAVGFVVFGMNLCLLVGLAALTLNSWYWKPVLLFWGLKTLVDAGLLYRSSDFFSNRNLLIYTPILSFIYPFYVLISVLGGLCFKKTWKARAC